MGAPRPPYHVEYMGAGSPDSLHLLYRVPGFTLLAVQGAQIHFTCIGCPGPLYLYRMPGSLHLSHTVPRFYRVPRPRTYHERYPDPLPYHVRYPDPLPYHILYLDSLPYHLYDIQIHFLTICMVFRSPSVPSTIPEFAYHVEYSISIV